MGWARTLLLGDIGNRLDIGDAERDITALRSKLRANTRVDSTQDKRIEELEIDNAHLKLCLATLSRLLVAKKVLTPEELEGFGALLEDMDSDSA